MVVQVQLQMVFQILLLLFSIFAISGHAINSSCQASCGNVSDIPFPFEIGAGCFADDWFEVFCNESSSPPKPFLRSFKLEVLNISLGGTVRVNYPTFLRCVKGPERGHYSWSKLNTELATSPFIFSQSENRFIATGCNNIASMLSVPNGLVIGGCMPICNPGRDSDVIDGSSCNGINCCQSTIPSNLDAFSTNMSLISSHNFFAGETVCNSAFLVDEKWFNKPGSINLGFIYPTFPVVLEWRIPKASFYSLPISYNFSASTANNSSRSYICSNKTTPSNYWRSTNNRSRTTYNCSCNKGFEGNPYLLHGCQDINECESLKSPCINDGSGSVYRENTKGSYWSHFRVIEYPTEPSSRVIEYPTKPSVRVAIIAIGINSGLLILFVGGWWSYKVVKKTSKIEQKNKLKQQLSSYEANIKNIKLFNSKDLEKATDRFNVNRILGQGGQGTVYKGMLADGRIVAVKKFRVIDEGKLEEFINEVVILSQINHMNVVKLIGYCLETEVPLLVYEYIPNGTLFQYANGQIEEFSLTWDMRLRIATEVAGALFYLHSATSSPIYHRDIKSTNILLDEKYRAKVADFGISRSIIVDQTHLTTLVHDTFGYLDPEYFQSNQFTEKSDVYSFGVVLAELLIGKKAISSTRMQESKSLAKYFIQSIEENNLFDVLDSQVLKEGNAEEIIAVANLAKRCLYLNGKKRPTMREVTKVLEAVQMLQKALNFEQNCEELENV